MESVLAGRTVVEVSQSPAAGLATMVMADFGADVIWFEYGRQRISLTQSVARRGIPRLASRQKPYTRESERRQ